MNQMLKNFNIKKQPKLLTSASAATTNTGCYGGLKPLVFDFITETQDNPLFNNMSSDHLFLSCGQTETDVVVPVVGAVVVAVRHSAVLGVVVPTTPTVHTVGAFEN